MFVTVDLKIHNIKQNTVKAEAVKSGSVQKLLLAIFSGILLNLNRQNSIVTRVNIFNNLWSVFITFYV